MSSHVDPSMSRFFGLLDSTNQASVRWLPAAARASHDDAVMSGLSGVVASGAMSLLGKPGCKKLQSKGLGLKEVTLDSVHGLWHLVLRVTRCLAALSSRTKPKLRTRRCHHQPSQRLKVALYYTPGRCIMILGLCVYHNDTWTHHQLGIKSLLLLLVVLRRVGVQGLGFAGVKLRSACGAMFRA